MPKAKALKLNFLQKMAGRADLVFLAQMTEAIIAAGADVVNIPDTTAIAFLICMESEFNICLTT